MITPCELQNLSKEFEKACADASIAISICPDPVAAQTKIMKYTFSVTILILNKIKTCHVKETYGARIINIHPKIGKIWAVRNMIPLTPLIIAYLAFINYSFNENGVFRYPEPIPNFCSNVVDTHVS